MQTKITQAFVQNLTFPGTGKVHRVYDTLLKGLVLVIRSTGKKTWYVDYRRPNGKRTDHLIGKADLFTVIEAREMARDFLAAIARGEDPNAEAQAKTLTLGAFISDIYGPWVIENRKTGRETITMVQRAFASLMSIDASEITLAQLEQWRSQQRRKRSVKAASLNREVTALKAALNWGVSMEIITNSSTAKFKPLKEVDSNKIVRYLSDDERLRLMKALDERESEMQQKRQSHNEWLKARDLATLPDHQHFADHLKPMILVSLNTGIRQNALFSLEWGEINFNDRTLFLRAEADKGEKARYVPMNSVVCDALSRWREQSKSVRSKDLVFPSPKNGGKMDNCRKAWGALLKKAEIDNFRWHDMRHDFASQLVMSGVDLNTVRELLGHADMKMTLRYAHLAPATTMKAVEILERKIA